MISLERQFYSLCNTFSLIKCWYVIHLCSLLNKHHILIFLHFLENLAQAAHLSQCLVLFLLKHSLLASLAAVVQDTRIACFHLVLQLSHMVLVELAKGLSTVRPRHDFFEKRVLLQVLHFIFTGADSRHLLSDMLCDRKSSVNQRLLEKVALHHEGQLSMAEILRAGRLDPV